MFSYIQKHIKLLYSKKNPNYILKSCIQDGDIETIKTILKNGFDVNTKLDNGCSLLANAMFFCNYEICEFFISRGADVNEILDYGNNLLTFFYINTLNRKNPAFYDSYIKIVKLVVDSGCNVNHTNDSKITPLHRPKRKMGQHKITIYKTT